VRFFEQDEEGNVKWEEYGNFAPHDVHRQVRKSSLKTLMIPLFYFWNIFISAPTVCVNAFSVQPRVVC